MENLRVSVIINTHNRAYHLKRLLDCLAKQTYDSFEVVVVNGPSTDHTEQVLAAYSSAIRIENCPKVNLCMSRNIGVRAAAGEILVFIDDDAVPGNRHWLANLCKQFEDPTVGAVGGQSYRMNGDHEFSKGTFSIWGESSSINTASIMPYEMDGEHFNGVIGCNCAFRKEAIRKVGGFDEYYVYFLDETDLCYRIAMEGYQIVHNDRALVYHEAAGGANRKTQYHLNWRVIARSRGYFVVKATEGKGLSDAERREAAEKSCSQWLTDFKWMLSAEKITKSDYKDFFAELKEGMREGIEDGFAKQRMLAGEMPSMQGTFKRYDKAISKDVMNICFYCADDVLNPIGGVATYTKALAEGLSKRGHNIYIITEGKDERITNVDGVNICYVMPELIPVDELIGLRLAQEKLNFSYACFAKLQQLKDTFFIDVVESPIWDSPGLVTSYLEKDVPLATRLQTPLKMVIDTFQMVESLDLGMLMEFETALMDKSERIITISDCVENTIRELYHYEFKQEVSKNYLGIKPKTVFQTTREKNDGRLIVFFIGRLERRKGIDSIIKAIPGLMEKYPNLEFHIAGDCNIFDEVIGDTYRNRFLRDNKGKKWLKRVQFMGKISDSKKEQEYADCDIFISPSLYESFGIIFIEAMRYAKPVIGCRVGGMQEVIVDGETGLLCQPGDVVDFERCLDKMLRDVHLRERMGNAGRVRLYEFFSESVMCQRCESIYREMQKDAGNRQTAHCLAGTCLS